MSSQLNEVLRACIEPLRPYLGQIVVAGGWVPYLYMRLYEGAVAHEPLLTSDFDAALARSGLIESDVTLDASILSSGFSYEFASLDVPPVVRYVKDLEGGRQAEIEFITQANDFREVVKVVGSVNAQALQDIDLLLADSWSHPLEQFGIQGEGELRLPRPSMFVLHKVLTAPRRSRGEKTAKDLYYAFYVLDAFPVWRDDLLKETAEFALDDPRRSKRAAAYLEEMFGDIDGIGLSMLASQRPQTAYSQIGEEQFRRYALYRFRQLAKALRRS